METTIDFRNAVNIFSYLEQASHSKYWKLGESKNKTKKKILFLLSMGIYLNMLTYMPKNSHRN